MPPKLPAIIVLNTKHGFTEPYLERQLSVVARGLTVEDTVAACWYCLRRGALASDPATTAANLNSSLRESFAPAAALLEGGPARPPTLRRPAHLDLTTAGPLDARLYRRWLRQGGGVMPGLEGRGK